MVYILIALTIFFTVAGQLLVKGGMLQVGQFPARSVELPAFLLHAFTNWQVVLGLVSAVIAAVCWMGAVSRMQISSAYPFMALAIVLVLALSGTFFHENVPITRWVGVIVVCLGLIIASR